MADKTVASALAVAYTIDRQKTLHMYAKLGDMGLVAENLNHESRIRNHGLTIDEIFTVLTTIAKTSGEGTVEKRIGLLVGLLQKVDSLSAKYLVRIPLGNLRLGIGDPTVLDGLAKAKFGDKSRRLMLEGA